MPEEEFSPGKASIECKYHTTPIEMKYVGKETLGGYVIHKYKCETSTRGKKCENTAEIVAINGKIIFSTPDIIVKFKAFDAVPFL